MPSGERFQESVPWLKKGWEALLNANTSTAEQLHPETELPSGQLGGWGNAQKHPNGRSMNKITKVVCSLTKKCSRTEE